MRTTALLLGALALAGCATVGPGPSAAPPSRLETARREVRAAEEAFASSMARRDFEAFRARLAPDAVFLNGGEQPLRGREAIAARWSVFFSSPQAPFSWRPEFVEVSLDGQLGQTDGPVFDPAGRPIARFYSTWRRNPSGYWQVVFDNGYALPAPPPSAPASPPENP